ncbi:poly(U)-specific endoribonuclease homolog [Brachypodium distachyon]|uniref:Embryo sac development arrest 6 n=1 Tax=Brachypodium distachyon TaxID=15368 RepID=I1HJJ4_BRADI|nr:poly(U)-specific endoribonuclease homolog [Brachypodium distachyon]KQK06321.1 hypothetical protein BRADI_2g25720v3 [Brachypodium distachyon]|eukprot:XP_024314664.1 poly(U)-specific endoribonuclease homolog [Brachypodium distachyon]
MEAPLGKRKEREYSSTSEQQQQKALFPALPGKTELRKPFPLSRFAAKPPMPPPPSPQGGSSKLLAGYLAHEYLRFGTLLGERPAAPSRKEPATALPAPTPTPAPEPAMRYAEASRLLMAGGPRIPGIVNPTQLGRWLRIKE